MDRLSVPHVMTLAGLVMGAVGIAILWASGVEFPVVVPPGLVLLLVAVAIVGLARWRWAPAIGAFMGLFVTVGFLISPTGIPNFVGDHGLSVAIGTWIQMTGVLTALVAGTIATARNYYRTA